MAQHRANIGQHRANIGPTWANIGQHRPNIGQHRLNIGSTWAQDVPNIDHMGPTWPNLGPRCAPDSLTLLNIGPPSPTRTSFPPWHHPGPNTPSIVNAHPAQPYTVGRRPAVRRKPLNIVTSLQFGFTADTSLTNTMGELLYRYIHVSENVHSCVLMGCSATPPSILPMRVILLLSSRHGRIL